MRVGAAGDVLVVDRVVRVAEDPLDTVHRLVVRNVREVRVTIPAHRVLLFKVQADAVTHGPHVLDVRLVRRRDLHAALEQLKLRIRANQAVGVADHPHGDEHHVGVDHPRVPAGQG